MQVNSYYNVQMTIYKAGYRCKAAWFFGEPDSYEPSRHDHALWIVPRPRKNDWGDMIHEPDEYVVDSPSTDDMDSVVTEDIIGITFVDVPIGTHHGFGALNSPLGQWCMDVGTGFAFREFRHELLELAQPLIDRLAQQKPNPKQLAYTEHLQTVSFLTAWYYHCWQCNGYFDPEEWDCGVELVGRIDLGRITPLTSHPDTENGDAS